MPQPCLNTCCGPKTVCVAGTQNHYTGTAGALKQHVIVLVCMCHPNGLVTVQGPASSSWSCIHMLLDHQGQLHPQGGSVPGKLGMVATGRGPSSTLSLCHASSGRWGHQQGGRGCHSHGEGDGLPLHPTWVHPQLYPHTCLTVRLGDGHDLTDVATKV